MLQNVICGLHFYRGLVTFSCKVKDIVRFFAFYGENWCFFSYFCKLKIDSINLHYNFRKNGHRF